MVCTLQPTDATTIVETVMTIDVTIAMVTEEAAVMVTIVVSNVTIVTKTTGTGVHGVATEGDMMTEMIVDHLDQDTVMTVVEMIAMGHHVTVMIGMDPLVTATIDTDLQETVTTDMDHLVTDMVPLEMTLDREIILMTEVCVQ